MTISKAAQSLEKIGRVLKALHSSHTTLNEAFQNTELLQNSHALEILDVKKRDTLQEDRLFELTTSLSIEVNSIQGIIQALEQDLNLMEHTCMRFTKQHSLWQQCIPSVHFISI